MTLRLESKSEMIQHFMIYWPKWMIAYKFTNGLFRYVIQINSIIKSLFFRNLSISIDFLSLMVMEKPQGMKSVDF